MASQEELNNQRELNELLSQRRGIEQDTLNDVRDYANVLQDQLKFLQGQTTEKREIGSISRNLTKVAQQNYSILEQELGTEKLIKKIQQDKEKLIKNITNLQSFQKTQLGDNAQLNSEMQGSIKDSISSTKKLLTQLDFVEQTTSKISKNLGVKTFGALSDITKSIPGLSRFSTPFKEAEEASRRQVIQNQKINAAQGINLQTGKGLTKEKIKELGLADKLLDKNGNILEGASALSRLKKTGDLNTISGLQGKNPMNPLIAGAKNLGKSLTKALGPIALLKELVDAFIQSDKIVGDMAKGLNMSYSEALNMKQELTAAANESGNIFVTSKGMAETLMAINKTLGTNVMLNKENLATFTELRQVAGFTNDELMGMQSLVNATDGNLKDMTGEFMAQVKLTNIKNKVALNEKQLMKEISQVSAATTLSFSKNPSLIAEAVATAKSLGMEMSKVESIADSLLQFESSIENELQAELLLGKNINLEKARQAALNNDLKTVAEEIAKQAGSSEEFARMNRIQQEALAGAVGMSREELAKSLFLQEQIGNVSADEYNLRKKQVEELEAKGLSQAQIKEKLAKTSIEDLKNQASMQDRFNASIEKLKEIFVTVAEAIMPILDVFTGVFEIVGPLIKILNPFIQMALVPLSYMTDALNTLIHGVKLFGNMFGMELDVSGFEFGKNTVNQGNKMLEGFGVDSKKYGLSSGLKLGEDGMSLADDVAIPAGYGDTIIKKGKDTIALNNNDTVVAGTNLGQNTNSNQGTERALNKTNMLLEQILTKQGTVKMDATEVGTAFSVNTYNVQ